MRFACRGTIFRKAPDRRFEHGLEPYTYIGFIVLFVSVELFRRTHAFFHRNDARCSRRVFKIATPMRFAGQSRSVVVLCRLSKARYRCRSGETPHLFAVQVKPSASFSSSLARCASASSLFQQAGHDPRWAPVMPPPMTISPHCRSASSRTPRHAPVRFFAHFGESRAASVSPFAVGDIAMGPSLAFIWLPVGSP